MTDAAVIDENPMVHHIGQLKYGSFESLRGVVRRHHNCDSTSVNHCLPPLCGKRPIPTRGTGNPCRQWNALSQPR